MAEQPEDKEARITLPISASSALLAMGFGLWWAWTDSFYLASPGASPSATSMIPSERCFISLGCGLALIALLLKQRRQKERAPRGIVWASALCMSVLPFIARVIPLYTEESSWRVLLLLVAGFASAPLFLEWLSKIAGNSNHHLLFLSPSLSMLRSTAWHTCSAPPYLLRNTLYFNLSYPLSQLSSLQKRSQFPLATNPMPKPLRKSMPPTAQLLGSCSQDRFYSRLISPCSLSVSRRSRKARLLFSPCAS